MRFTRNLLQLVSNRVFNPVVVRVRDVATQSHLFQRYSSIGTVTPQGPYMMSLRTMHSSDFLNCKLEDIQGHLKKRSNRNKKTKKAKKENMEGHFNVFAYATAEEYDLEALHTALTKQDLYQTKKFFSKDSTIDTGDVLYVCSKYQVENEPHEIFFFREGSVVLWNCSEEETSNLLTDLKEYELKSYERNVVMNESELMLYRYAETGNAHLKGAKFHIQKGEDGDLERYTFSNAMSQSVKLGIWESTLDRYVDSMAFVTDDMKRGKKIRMTRASVLRKTGELFALKHLINLRSDLLDTPDFYWDHERLEKLFIHTSAYFSVQRRTKVMNEKLNHCVELAELVSFNLNDAHHIRLEWMIIVLIMVEVGFEILHYADRLVKASEYAQDTKGEQ